MTEALREYLDRMIAQQAETNALLRKIAGLLEDLDNRLFSVETGVDRIAENMR